MSYTECAGNWRAVDSPSEVPLQIATRVLARVGAFCDDIDAVEHALPEAECSSRFDRASEAHVAELRLPHLVLNSVDGALGARALHGKHWYGVFTDTPPRPLEVLDEVRFERIGRGGKYSDDLSIDQRTSLEHIRMNWEIAVILECAMQGLGRRLSTGMWR